MSEIDSLELEMFVTTAVEDVFETMLSMTVSRIPAADVVTKGYPLIVGTVSLAGSILGNVNVHLNKKFAWTIAAAMLGMTIADIDGEAPAALEPVYLVLIDVNADDFESSPGALKRFGQTHKTQPKHRYTCLSGI